MKKTILKVTLLSLPVMSLALVAAVTMATSAPTDGDSSKKTATNEKVFRNGKFAEQDQVDTYLTSVRSYMLVPPRDGRFGASRVPTLHGTQSGGVPGFKDIQKLSEKDFAVWSYVAGKMPQQMRDSLMKSQETYHKTHPEYKVPETPESRISYVHNAIPENFDAPRALSNLYRDVMIEARKMEKLCRIEGYDAYSTSVKIDGKDGWVVAKSVRASEKSCYSCHTETKEGQPIGYVMAILVKKAP